jgi:hypothetical protein
VTRLIDWARGLFRPRLAVFATQVRSLNPVVKMVAIRLTTRTERVLRGALALCGVVVLAFGPLVRPGAGFTTLTIGLLTLIGAFRTLGSTTTMVDASLARAAVRAALTEGSEHSPQHWRIEGPAAVELDKELVRLQNLWLPGQGPRSSELDRARAAMIATGASPRLAPYLGELSLAEQQAWLGTPASTQLAIEEPDHTAEYHRDGAAWPSLNSPESGSTWPTLPEHDRP